MQRIQAEWEDRRIMGHFSLVEACYQLKVMSPSRMKENISGKVASTEAKTLSYKYIFFVKTITNPAKGPSLCDLYSFPSFVENF